MWSKSSSVISKQRRPKPLREEELTAVVHGRPVRFVDDDDAADAKAQRVLKGIANRVGFKPRRLRLRTHRCRLPLRREPPSARGDRPDRRHRRRRTSDFTVIRIGPERRLGKADRTSDILANRGVRVGGTDFDSLLNIDAVMPMLGLGTLSGRKELADAERSLYYELSRPGRRSTSPTHFRTTACWSS